MKIRPVSLALATVLVAVTGVGFAAGGLLLLALATGQFPFLDSVRGAGVIAGMGVTSMLLAGVAWFAAVELWRGHAHGWAVALAIGFIGFDAALTAALTSDVSMPLVAGLALTAATVVALLVTPTRHAVGLVLTPGAAA